MHKKIILHNNQSNKPAPKNNKPINTETVIKLLNNNITKGGNNDVSIKVPDKPKLKNLEKNFIEEEKTIGTNDQCTPKKRVKIYSDRMNYIINSNRKSIKKFTKRMKQSKLNMDIEDDKNPRINTKRNRNTLKKY